MEKIILKYKQVPQKCNYTFCGTYISATAVHGTRTATKDSKDFIPFQNLRIHSL
jgi:hypothetical protein